MRRYNNLSIQFYVRGSTTPVASVGYDYGRISDVQLGTFFPGGRFGDLTFFIPQRNFLASCINTTYRVVAKNYLTTVYEGLVDSVTPTVNENGAGVYVVCIGAWGAIMERNGTNKTWANNSTDQKTWVPQYNEETDVWDYKLIEGKIHISPKKETIYAGYVMKTRYSSWQADITRIVFKTQFYEDSGSYKISLYRSTLGTAPSWTEITNASGDTYAAGTTTVKTSPDAYGATTTIDVSFPAPQKYLEYRLECQSDGTPGAADHIHGMMFDVTVYTEAGSITGDAIIEDVVGLCTDINSTTSNVVGPTYALPVFMTNGWQPFAEIINNALAAGDGSGANYDVYLSESDVIKKSPDGKPVLCVSTFPATTSYSYEISLADKNLISPFTVDLDYSKIVNYVTVKYSDYDGIDRYATPADSATLTSTTSVSSYGKRLPPGGYIDAGRATQAQAIAVGLRYLTRYSEPIWRVSQPVSVSGYIRASGDIRIPSSEIRAGKNVLISNFSSTPKNLLLGTGRLVAPITNTSYSDSDQTCSITLGDVAVV